MKMKKILSAALLLSLTAAMLVAPVSAKEVEDALEGNDYISSEAVELRELELKELKVTIKEIREYEWVVTDKDGEDYIVPILGFNELIEFKEAAFEVGREVMLRGHAPKMVAAMQVGLIGNMNEVKLINVSKGIEVGQFDIVAAKELPSVMEFKSNGIAVDDECQLLNKDFIKSTVAMEAIRIAKPISEEDYILHVSPEEFAGNVSFGITRAIAPGEEAVDRVPAIRTAGLEGELFIAQEIVVGEVTLKLPNPVMGIAAIKAIK